MQVQIAEIGPFVFLNLGAFRNLAILPIAQIVIFGPNFAIFLIVFQWKADEDPEHLGSQPRDRGKVL